MGEKQPSQAVLERKAWAQKRFIVGVEVPVCGALATCRPTYAWAASPLQSI